MQYFYHPKLEKEESLRLSLEESRHLIKVLRAKNKDQVKLTDGLGRVAKAELYIESKSVVIANVMRIEKNDEPQQKLKIAISPMKSSSRWEWFLEKATELGIQEIQPIRSERTEKKKINIERSEKVIISAMKQSQRIFKPRLGAFKSFAEYLHGEKKNDKFIAYCGPEERNYIDACFPTKDVAFLVGPEGDFSENEINLALENGFKPVSLGEKRLRTETAGLAICQSFNFSNKI